MEDNDEKCSRILRIDLIATQTANALKVYSQITRARGLKKSSDKDWHLAGSRDHKLVFYKVSSFLTFVYPFENKFIVHQ